MGKTAVVVALALGVVFLCGCLGTSGSGQSTQTASPTPPSGYNHTGGFGNMTSAQRQAMMQASEAACSGLAEGNACSLTTSNGMAINGTCNSYNGGPLMCTPSGFGNRTRGNYGGGYNQSGQ